MHLALSIGAVIAIIVSVASWARLHAGYRDPPPPDEAYVVPLVALAAAAGLAISATVVG